MRDLSLWVCDLFCEFNYRTLTYHFDNVQLQYMILSTKRIAIFPKPGWNIFKTSTWFLQQPGLSFFKTLILSFLNPGWFFFKTRVKVLLFQLVSDSTRVSTHKIKAQKFFFRMVNGNTRISELRGPRFDN